MQIRADNSPSARDVALISRRAPIIQPGAAYIASLGCTRAPAPPGCVCDPSTDQTIDADDNFQSITHIVIFKTYHTYNQNIWIAASKGRRRRFDGRAPRRRSVFHILHRMRRAVNTRAPTASITAPAMAANAHLQIKRTADKIIRGVAKQKLLYFKG
ncbi:hypothetical protein EVAR_103068_1 [Eumeta japonica]|uniref:Uncharacterized protein n=1 Tax=Eumeta variegata TaxID=151549 RepID=A0A4C1WNN3_EUMVA|nr:hypothetical protein EVAR_103068_1 [Eumeta japonica]